MSNTVDIVITWVDGSDPAWQAERDKYVPEEMKKRQDVAGNKRYHDNGLLRYLFRGIEKYAPWIRKVHFVTFGHLPEWIDISNSKLQIVNHEDFLPEEYRPTFSSVPLNLNFHRIPDLAEKFIYFNDDMFLLKPCAEELFFKNGVPRDMGVMDIIPAISMEMYWYMVYNDIIMLNKNVKKKEILRNGVFKWINPIYGKNAIKNLLLMPFPFVPGIYETHLPAGYLKSSYEDVWEKNHAALNEVSKHKFRSSMDVSENFIRYYQLAQGRFEPINKLKEGRYCSMSSNAIVDYITSGKYSYICINDEVDGIQYQRVVQAFEMLLPEKSSFEL